jgi:hypothetical protein
MNDLNDFFSAISHQKAVDPRHQMLKEIKSHIREDAMNLFSQLEQNKPVPVEQINEVVEAIQQVDKINDVNKEILREVVVPEVKPASEQVPMDQIDKYLKQNASFQQPDPDTVDPNMKAVQEKLKFLEQAVGRIAATGPGSGEVNLRYLDDVARNTIQDGRYLKYNATTKKFEFDEINTQEVVQNVTYVTTAEYTVQSGDYYIGINYAGPVTINLPVTDNSGRTIIIKDEDGDAEANPITLIGNVDNDPNGAVLAIDNGALQLIYHRGGWRIV